MIAHDVILLRADAIIRGQDAVQVGGALVDQVAKLNGERGLDRIDLRGRALHFPRRGAIVSRAGGVLVRVLDVGQDGEAGERLVLGERRTSQQRQ